VHDHLRGAERLKFTRFFGELFQRYAQDAIDRAYPTSDHLFKRVYPEKRYGKRGQEKNTSDVMILYGEDVIFVEVIASRLKMVETTIRGDLTSFRQDLRDKVINAAQQVDRVVGDFRRGEFGLDGFQGKNMRRAYPVVVSFGTIPQTVPVWHEIQGMLLKRRILQSSADADLTLIDVEELEMLEALIASGISLVDILEQKQSHPWYRYWPMKTFLAHVISPDGVHNEYLFERLGELMRSALDILGFGEHVLNP
jgi:hypothetical protein